MQPERAHDCFHHVMRRKFQMRSRAITCLILGLMTLPAAAWTTNPLDNGRRPAPMSYPGGPKPVNDDVKPRYPMTYLDEAAQTLGVRNGRLDLFSSHPVENNALIPVLSGGISGKGAMLRLQWRPRQ